MADGVSNIEKYRAVIILKSILWRKYFLVKAKPSPITSQIKANEENLDVVDVLKVERSWNSSDQSTCLVIKWINNKYFHVISHYQDP